MGETEIPLEGVFVSPGGMDNAGSLCRLFAVQPPGADDARAVVFGESGDDRYPCLQELDLERFFVQEGLKQ